MCIVLDHLNKNYTSTFGVEAWENVFRLQRLMMRESAPTVCRHCDGQHQIEFLLFSTDYTLFAIHDTIFCYYPYLKLYRISDKFRSIFLPDIKRQLLQKIF